jgi:hypothetical protein
MFRALDGDITSVQVDQFLYKRETNAGAFVCPRTGIANPVKPIEQAGQFTFRYAHSRVPHCKHRPAIFLQQTNLDFTRERKLQRIAQQVKNNLFPHLAIHIHGMRKPRAVYYEAQSRSLNSGTENACEFCSKTCQIDGLIHRFHAARFDQ